LQQAISLMDSSHQALIKGKAELHLPATMSGQIHDLYFGSPQPFIFWKPAICPWPDNC
jgi:hypothetical protein